jgi:hypothetical protein
MSSTMSPSIAVDPKIRLTVKLVIMTREEKSVIEELTGN